MNRSSRFEDRLLEELKAVVAERAAPSAAQSLESKQSSTHARYRIHGVRSSRVVAIAAACLAFTGTAIAARDVWDPGIGTSSNDGPLTVSRTPVPAAMADVLGVLRRAPSADDRSAEVEATLRHAALADGVRPDSARYLAPGIDGQATVLLSAEGTIPLFTEEEAVCVFRPLEGPGQAATGCFSLSQLLSGEAREMASAAGRPTAVEFGLVPDGVATVTAKFGSAPDKTVLVANNYFELQLSGAELSNANGEAGVQRMVWRDATGNIVPQ